MCVSMCVCMWVYVCACSGYYAVINVASSSILGYVRLLVSSLLQWSDGFQILSQISSLTQFQHNHDLREGKGVNRTRECLGKRGREEGEVCERGRVTILNAIPIVCTIHAHMFSLFSNINDNSNINITNPIIADKHIMMCMTSFNNCTLQ